MSNPTVDILPTVEEILAGETQAGVPRPRSLFADEEDGTTHRAGPVPLQPAPMSRWTAIKHLLCIIFGERVDR